MDDVYTTTEDVLLDVDAATGLLANDPGTGVSVIAFDAISSRGAKVEVKPDGSFKYDPRAALALQQLVADNQLTDFFKYRSVDSQGAEVEGVVSIKVNGLNDAPVANADHYFLTQDDAKIVANVLENDIDPDFVVANLPVVGKGIVATAVTTQSTLGASVKISADGKFEYDASALESIAKLSRDETVTDTV